MHRRLQPEARCVDDQARHAFRSDANAGRLFAITVRRRFLKSLRSAISTFCEPCHSRPQHGALSPEIERDARPHYACTPAQGVCRSNSQRRRPSCTLDTPVQTKRDATAARRAHRILSATNPQMVFRRSAVAHASTTRQSRCRCNSSRHSRTATSIRLVKSCDQVFAISADAAPPTRRIGTPARNRTRIRPLQACPPGAARRRILHTCAH